MTPFDTARPLSASRSSHGQASLRGASRCESGRGGWWVISRGLRPLRSGSLGTTSKETTESGGGAIRRTVQPVAASRPITLLSVGRTGVATLGRGRWGSHRLLLDYLPSQTRMSLIPSSGSTDKRKIDASVYHVNPLDRTIYVRFSGAA